MINLVGQCGPILGTNIFKSTDAPRYVKGMGVCAGFMFFVGLVALAQRFLLMWENRRLDAKYGKVERETKNTNQAAVAAEDYGPRFRFAL